MFAHTVLEVLPFHFKSINLLEVCYVVYSIIPTVAPFILVPYLFLLC